jgi:phage tail protein X
MTIKVTVRRDRLTLDLLLWQTYGDQYGKLLEEAMRLNPDQTDTYLRVGAEIVLPDLPLQAAEPEIEVITLFG